MINYYIAIHDGSVDKDVPRGNKNTFNHALSSQSLYSLLFFIFFPFHITHIFPTFVLSLISKSII